MSADKTPSFDELLKSLEGVVEKLEAGNLSLEESLKAYEKGIGLAKQGHLLLENAEAKVEELMESGKTKPLSSQ